MSFGAVVVMVFAIAAIAWLKSQKYRSERSIDTQTSLREPELEREITRLRERIVVLERIALEERGHSDRLAREIDALRD